MRPEYLDTSTEQNQKNVKKRKNKTAYCSTGRGVAVVVANIYLSQRREKKPSIFRYVSLVI